MNTFPRIYSKKLNRYLVLTGLDELRYYGGILSAVAHSTELGSMVYLGNDDLIVEYPTGVYGRYSGNLKEEMVYSGDIVRLHLIKPDQEIVELTASIRWDKEKFMFVVDIPLEGGVSLHEVLSNLNSPLEILGNINIWSASKEAENGGY